MEPVTAALFFKGLLKPKTAVKSVAFGLWIFVFIVLGWAIYGSYIKPIINPNKTTSQEAEEIINNTNAPHATFGCSCLKVYQYKEKKK